jgi:hypothetical protein
MPQSFVAEMQWSITVPSTSSMLSLGSPAVWWLPFKESKSLAQHTTCLRVLEPWCDCLLTNTVQQESHHQWPRHSHSTNIDICSGKGNHVTIPATHIPPT